MSQKLYVVMINDRHTDPEPYVFSTPEAAIDYARSEAHEYARTPEGVDELDHSHGTRYRHAEVSG